MQSTNQIQILVNGEPHKIRLGNTITELIAELGLQPKQIAIELNLMILPRPKWAETTLCSGDRLEIVHFVGGGNSKLTSVDIDKRRL